MPHSLILNLLPQSPIPTQFLSGRHLHALFLNWVSSVDRKTKPALSTLHRNISKLVRLLCRGGFRD
ncbi:hypothetical protein [Coleofasciculus sp. D1-CHI-01]|uniref:hypothetical protein n=1 Tax=Coleofasciculus sp. D1-CHI-01 TaxID=3068482 RepID=UPI00406295B0